MKRLFNVLLIAVFAMVAYSCKPSIVGEWTYVKTQYYEDGEFDGEDYDDDYEVLQFNEDGTGVENDGYTSEIIYWKYEGGYLYMDYDPIKKLDMGDALKVEELGKDNLKLADEYTHGVEVHVFKRTR